MARQKIIHIHSNVSGKLPTKDQIEYGELAVNYAKGSETISLKNSSDEILSVDLNIEQVVSEALTKIKKSVGLDQYGEIDFSGANYISNKKSVYNALMELDKQIKTLNDTIDGGTYTGS